MINLPASEHIDPGTGLTDVVMLLLLHRGNVCHRQKDITKSLLLPNLLIADTEKENDNLWSLIENSTAFPGRLMAATYVSPGYFLIGCTPIDRSLECLFTIQV